MRKRLITIVIALIVLLIPSSALATDWMQQYTDMGIEVVRVAPDILYMEGPSYIGQTVVTTFLVEGKETDCLKCTTENNDTLSFSIVAYFDESEIDAIKEGQSVIVIGLVDEFNPITLFGADKTVSLKDCHLVTEGITPEEILANS